ncbi:GntR family transcriptional regulator [Arthrobacter sp. Hz1]
MGSEETIDTDQLMGKHVVMTTRIDRRNAAPLYVQLEQAILTYIHERNLAPGDKLPTEAEIAQTYEVSRQTIRQALSRLVADGQVERIQGLGSFVGKPRPSHQSLLTSFTQNMKSQGYDPKRLLLESAIVDSPPVIQSVTGSKGSCQFVRRLLLADGNPIGLAETWLPVESLAGRLDLFNAEILESNSLYELLQGPKIGLQLDRGVETVRAGAASDEEAHHLMCPANSPTLIVRRVSYTPSNRPVEWTVMTFPADRYEYRVELTHLPS